jgi:hypothetical protein
MADRAVYNAAQTMTTDYPSNFEEHSMIKMVGPAGDRTTSDELETSTPAS